MNYIRSRWKCREEPKNQGVDFQIEDQYPLVFWREECEVLGDEVSNVPILLIAELQMRAIPEWKISYWFGEETSSRQFLINFLR